MLSDGHSFAAPRTRFHWTPIAYTSYLKGLRQVQDLFRAGPRLERLAARSWQITPGNPIVTSKAYFLDGQLERITGMAYTDNPGRDVMGGEVLQQAPTRAFLLRNAWLIDGSLFSQLTRLDIHSRQRTPKIKRYFPTTAVDMEIDRASIYSSYDGNEFFGLWLTDDCSTYPLALAEGIPVTSNQTASEHTLHFEALLGMNPVRTNAAFLREVVLFDDNWDNNHGKRERFAALKRRLQASAPGAPHAGVFILRRNSGKSRVMHNELAMAEHLQRTRGFRIVDVTSQSLTEILAACAGARVVVGIEGSHLMHGLMMSPSGASLLTLQPPHRFCSVLKKTTDMADQHYGFVVGQAVQEGFNVEPDEVERTLDLMPLSPEPS